MAVHQHPVAALPEPFRRLAAVVRQRVVDAVGPPHNEFAVGYVMSVAGGKVFHLAIDVQRTHGDVHGLVFGRSNEQLDRHCLAECDRVRLGAAAAAFDKASKCREEWADEAHKDQLFAG